MVWEVGGPPSRGETVLIVSRGHHATAGQAVLHPVNPGSEALVSLPAVVVDQPGLNNLPHVGEEAGLVEEDEDTADALHGEEDQHQPDEESEPAPGVLDDTADPRDADREHQQATDQHWEADQSHQVLAYNTAVTESRYTVTSFCYNVLCRDKTCVLKIELSTIPTCSSYNTEERSSALIEERPHWEIYEEQATGLNS